MSWRAIVAAVLRETRGSRSRLVFLTACLAVGVAAVVGVTALTRAVDAGLREESRDLLAADVRVSARRPLPPELDSFLEQRAHERTDVRELASMVSRALPENEDGGDAGSTSRLVELKVVDGRYPFYGELVLDPPLPGGVLDTRTSAGLDAESVLVGSDLLAALQIAVGDELRIGGVTFRIRAEVVDEPDRLDFAMTLGPRVFMSADGFQRTNLGTAQSRVRYAALLSLADDLGREELAGFAKELKAALVDDVTGGSYARIRTHTDAQPNVRRSLGRVESYLGLVALLSLLLGGIGVAQIVRAWLAGRAQSVAVLRALGFRAFEIAGFYLGHVVLLALAGSLLGGLAGAALPWLVKELAPDLFQGGSAHLWQPLALIRGVVLGLGVALVFSLPSLSAVWRVPPAAVLRSEAVPLRVPRQVAYGAPLAVFLGVLVSARAQGGSWLAAALFSVGLLVLAALLYGGARLAASSSSRLPRGRLGPYLEHGLAALARPGSGTTGAIVALGLGVMVVLSMMLVETELDTTLRTAIPEDAPSVFLIDVQPDQWEGVNGSLHEHGARSINSVPVVMARMREIDGRSVLDLAAESRDQGRATWVYTREQRLTWMKELPDDNELVEGALWTDPERDEVSLELEFAQDLGVGVGSVLTFDVQGVPLELTVTSLRTVRWQSFGINFFLVVEPGVLEDAPHFRLAAARLDPAEAEYALQNDVAATYPNVTLIRVRPMLEKVAGVLERIALGVRALGSFTILAGLVILAGAVGTTALRRTREAALLKTLGVTRAGVVRLFAVEYALGGFVAGVLGAGGAVALSWSFLRYVAELEPEPAFGAIPLAALGAALLASVSGLAASLSALRSRPVETLRA